MNLKSPLELLWVDLFQSKSFLEIPIIVFPSLCSARLLLSQWHSQGTEKPNGVQKLNMVPILFFL